MKTCCLVWEIPVIEGEHYNPIVNVIYMQKAKKFLHLSIQQENCF